MRRKFIVGNWKMFKAPRDAAEDYRAFAEESKTLQDKLDLGIAASYTSLPALTDRLQNGVRVYAQNVHWEKEGAFTGEVSVPMLNALRVQGSLVGHSERRQYFGETNVSCGKRVAALLHSNLDAVFCVGETLAEREAGRLQDVLRSQLLEAFAAGDIRHGTYVIGSDPSRPKLTIAYEPVWAIGTGKAATATEAQEAHAFVRSVLCEHFGKEIAGQMRILYGGSVKPNNITSFTKCADIDGALVGGASLKPAEFAELCRNV